MKVYLLIIPLFWGGIFFGQKKKIQKYDYPTEFKSISDEILANGKAYEQLRELTKSIGPRFSGSAGLTKAENWAEKKLKESGATHVWKQEVPVKIWKRGQESLEIKTGNGTWKKINMTALGSSEGTDGKDLVGEILLVKNIDEFNALSYADIKDKIIFFNMAFDQKIVNPVEAYMEVGKYRWAIPAAVSRRGAKAVITRSLTSAFDDVPHTGSMSYDADDKNKIPALAIGAKSADELEQALKKQKVLAKINTTSSFSETKTNYNIIGEIPGNKDNNVIVVAAHLDSWDISEGAHDNGAGVVHCLEVLRAFQKIGYKNNHTLRVVLYTNEENGVSGGDIYAQQVKKKGERHLFAIESDAGGFSPRGISLDMIPERRRQVFAWKSYFLPYGVYDFDQTYSGQDIQPLKKLGIPLAEIVPDTQRYFDIHHTSEDTFDKVNRRELLLGAVTMAQIVMMIDRNW
ncbi:MULTISPECIES: M28 family peptidase [Amniculibacterium]|uniref:M28 family peptidase n=1 Tax=Amniculibacterium TaxID=2715289 RepID=UPI001654B6F6|nr:MULTISPECIES: M28 family peptidase [Amniculibacterium]